MSKKIKIIFLIIFSILIFCTIYFSIYYKNLVRENFDAVEILKNTFSAIKSNNSELDIHSIPKYNYKNQDYVGYLVINSDEVAIKSEDLKNNLIKGNIFEYSFSHAKEYGESDTITFFATDGNAYKYTIKNIIHASNLESIDSEKYSLTIAIRNPLNFEWIVVQGKGL